MAQIENYAPEAWESAKEETEKPCPYTLVFAGCSSQVESHLDIPWREGAILLPRLLTTTTKHNSCWHLD